MGMLISYYYILIVKYRIYKNSYFSERRLRMGIISKNRNINIFIWHGFFLSLTMAMLDFNTVFPALIDELIDSKIVFGFLYSIMIGIPLVFNVFFSHYMRFYRYRKGFLLWGIYLRSISFLGMAVFTYYFGKQEPDLAIASFVFWIFIFSLSGGFAGIAYSDIIGKLFSKGEREGVFAYKQFFSSISAFLGGLIIVRIFSLSNLSFPNNYFWTLFIGFIGLLTASLSFWFIKEPPSPESDGSTKSILSILKEIPTILKVDKLFSRFILIENLSSFSLMLLPFYMVYAIDTFNLDKSYIGKFLLIQLAGMILSNLLWGFIGKKQGSAGVVKICLLVGSLLPLLALLISVLGPVYYYIVFFLVGVVKSGRRIGFDPYLLDIAPERERTIYLGIRGTMSFMTVILPLLGGILIDFSGYIITFIIVSLVMIAAYSISPIK